MRRLGKQRVECLQLLNALYGFTKGWSNHPAALMWKGHERSLVFYALAICQEWKRRGYKDTCADKIIEFSKQHISSSDLGAPPSWLGNDSFHAAHRSNLLRKDAGWYGQFGWAEPNDLPYFWPKA